MFYVDCIAFNKNGHGWHIIHTMRLNDIKSGCNDKIDKIIICWYDNSKVLNTKIIIMFGLWNYVAKSLFLTRQQSNQTSPVITNVNGFTMGVETEVTENPLKRRRAIATNKQNVVMLKGEFSFSSIDQILIDELVFYIQQNNLKAD